MKLLYPAVSPDRRSGDFPAGSLSCLIDGEAIVCNEAGLAVFELVRRHWHGLLPCCVRLTCLSSTAGILALAADRAAQANAGQGRPRCRLAVAFNDHYEGDGEIVFKHACKLRCDGFVSKLGFALSLRPIKALAKGIKNPDAPAMRRKAEEDWGR